MKELQPHDVIRPKRIEPDALVVRLGHETWQVTRENGDGPAVAPVRSGPDKQITLETIRHHVAQTVRSTSEPTAAPKRSLASLQGGLVIGMMLGCLSMFLFHEMLPVASVSSLPVHSSKPKSTRVAQTGVPSTAAVALALPGFQISLVQAGPFSSTKTLNHVRHKLQTSGIQPIQSTSSNRSIDLAIADQNQDAHQVATQFTKLTPSVSVHQVQIDAKSIPLLGTVQPAVVSSTQAWLSSSASAFLALSAWLSDHGRISDAQTALSNAQRAFPGKAALAQTGIQSELLDIDKDLNLAQSALNSDNRKHLMNDVLQGVRDMMTLQGVDGLSGT